MMRMLQASKEGGDKMGTRKKPNRSGMSKSIGKEHYRSMGSHGSKRAAQKQAAYYRGSGKKARVVKEKDKHSVMVSADDRKRKASKKQLKR